MTRIFMVLLSLCALSCARPHFENSELKSELGDNRTSAQCSAWFSHSKACLILQWEIFPRHDRQAQFLLKVMRPNPVDGSLTLEDLPKQPNVVLWMPSMGHGSSPVRVKRIAVGTYRVTDVYFVMAGEWEIRVRSLGEDEAIIPFTF